MWRGRDCESVQQSDPVRQGDILRRFVNGHSDSLWIVVTADCDIAQSKIADAGLACIQLRSLRDYLLCEHLDRVIGRQTESRFREFRDWVHSQWGRKPPPRTRLSEQAIFEWAKAASVEEIVSALGVEDERVVTNVAATLAALRDGLRCQSEAVDTRQKLEALAQLQRKRPVDWRQFVQAQLSKIQSNQLPDDLFFITSLPNESQLGYIAKLRAISFVPRTLVARTVPEARERADAYVRIARLSATFKHGIAQQFGSLFARIGYPADYETERDEIFDLVTNELMDEFGGGQDD